ESLGLGRRGHGVGHFASFASALDAGGLAPEVTQVVQAGTADMALAGYFDGRDGRRMQREDTLDTGAEADAAHGEGGAGSAALLGDHHAFKGLDAFLDLFALAFEEADIDAN